MNSRSSFKLQFETAHNLALSQKLHFVPPLRFSHPFDLNSLLGPKSRAFFPFPRNNEAPNRICDSPGSRCRWNPPVRFLSLSLAFHPLVSIHESTYSCLENGSPGEAFYIFIKQLNSLPGRAGAAGRADPKRKRVRTKRNRTGWQLPRGRGVAPRSAAKFWRAIDHFFIFGRSCFIDTVPRCFIHVFDLQIIDWLPINQRFLLTRSDKPFFLAGGAPFVSDGYDGSSEILLKRCAVFSDVL